MTKATISSTRILGFDFAYLLSEWKDMFCTKTLTADLWAGVTVALVALPLNLALAIAAGVELPSQLPIAAMPLASTVNSAR